VIGTVNGKFEYNLIMAGAIDLATGALVKILDLSMVGCARAVLNYQMEGELRPYL